MQTCSELVMETTEIGEDLKKTMTFKVDLKWTRISISNHALRTHAHLCPNFVTPWDFPGKSTGVGCHFLLLGIFPTQGSSPHLLHWQADSLLLSHQGSPSVKGIPPQRKLYQESWIEQFPIAMEFWLQTLTLAWKYIVLKGIFTHPSQCLSIRVWIPLPLSRSS